MRLRLRHFRNHGELADNLKLFCATNGTRKCVISLVLTPFSILFCLSNFPSHAIFFLSIQILFLTQGPVNSHLHSQSSLGNTTCYLPPFSKPTTTFLKNSTQTCVEFCSFGFLKASTTVFIVEKLENISKPKESHHPEVFTYTSFRHICFYKNSSILGAPGGSVS